MIDVLIITQGIGT